MASAREPRPLVLVCAAAPALRDRIREILEPDHRVHLAATAAEALAFSGDRPPDLFLAGEELPDLPGAELCRRVRAAPALAGTPFVLLAQEASVSGRAEGLEAGADDALLLPLDPRALRARVASLLRLRWAMRALEARSRELEEVNAALRDTQAELVRTGRLASVGTLAAGLAHEINNPLSVVKAGAAAIAATVEEAEGFVREGATAALGAALAELRVLAGDLADGSRRLERIAADLRVISSPDAPADELVDPAEAVRTAFTLARARFAAVPRFSLAVEPGPPIGSVGKLVVQGLLPVLENAVQAAGPNGEIRAAIRQLNVGIEISIADDGPGIAPEILPRVFDPFFGTRGEGRGTGLGLSIAYGIVHGLGGDIHVESPCGGGALFRIRLPRRSAARAGAPPGD